jgi:predicted  nucleic acid-binding Zn-ribbon protein
MELKNIRIAAIVLVIIAGAIFYGGKRYADYQWQLKWAQRDIDDKTAQGKREKENRVIEQNMQSAITKVSQDAEKELQAVQADAIRAADGAERLHGAISELQQRLRNSQGTVDSALAGKREAEARASQLFAELLKQSDKRAGEYAATADDARVRGLACERAYDSILKTQQDKQ